MREKKNDASKLRNRSGFLFVTHWAIGFVVFFAFPVLQSLWFSFSDVVFETNGVMTKFVGFANYRKILVADPDYIKNLISAVTSFLYSLPIIMLVSLVIALILNQKFRGRLIFRAIYFMPVIIATGVVIELMFKTTSDDLVSVGVSQSLTDSMFSVEDVAVWLNLPDKIAVYITMVIHNIFDLVWNCGIQTILFIAGLQSIPRSLYEVSQIEGASKWQEFWFITFPMLSSVTILVVVFTTIDLLTSVRNVLVSSTFTMMYSGVYDVTSAMLWFYFIIMDAVLGLIFLLYNSVLKRNRL